MNDVAGRFMVLGLAGLVLRDLIETMRAGFPALDASIAADEAEAVLQVADANGWIYAFLNLGPDAFGASPLATLFDAHGTKIVLLGNAAEEAAARSAYAVLIRPYSGADILRAMGQRAAFN